MCYIVYVNICSYYSTANFAKEEKMEDRQLVTKAVLECYPYIEDMHDALTRSAEKCALDGFYAVFAAVF